MSNTAKLAGALPANTETNGLDAIAAELVDSFRGNNQPRCAVIWYDVRGVTENRDHTEVPTIEVRRIEDLGELSQVPKPVVDAALAAQEARIGATPLDFDQLEGSDPDGPQVVE